MGFIVIRILPQGPVDAHTFTNYLNPSLGGLQITAFDLSFNSPPRANPWARHRMSECPARFRVRRLDSFRGLLSKRLNTRPTPRAGSSSNTT